MTTSPDNEALIAHFYDAFAARDAQAMRACYHPDIHFTDEAFDLHGPRVGAMWQMLCESASTLQIDASEISADDLAGRATWRAQYPFGPKGRPVDNRIQAAFTFEEGLIRTHRDTFDFWRWSRMALGLPGALLGWSPWLRRTVSAQASKRLDRYIETHPDALG